MRMVYGAMWVGDLLSSRAIKLLLYGRILGGILHERIRGVSRFCGNLKRLESYLNVKYMPM